MEILIVGVTGSLLLGTWLLARLCESLESKK